MGGIIAFEVFPWLPLLFSAFIVILMMFTNTGIVHQGWCAFATSCIVEPFSTITPMKPAKSE
ncbi:hypothetical protein B4916_18665 [Yersinia intermedia]|nr:hypothetical protein B4916_18665 [Yersinia intermedia]